MLATPKLSPSSQFPSITVIFNSCSIAVIEIVCISPLFSIVHALVGFVRSPIATTTLQVYSRVMLVWPVLYKVVEVSA
jgi:hypothetical protein